ncbi:MAG: peptidyl-prolyl cis-trans isomerase A (cyclophilin A) [Enterobacterales bacterium]|jgi:peptidyl-prolyl cis-trans isomerase A (cyclophilin A)
MNLFVRVFCCVFILIASFSTIEAAPKPIVLIDTSMGQIKLELFHRRAPQTVKNFLKYVKTKDYDATIFHRVIPGFMIQGGGFGVDSVRRQTRPPVRNESNNGLNNRPGTIAMARTSNVDSATSQFFINVNDNKSLDASSGELGYTVFGKVIAGMDIVREIEIVDTKPIRGLGENAPIVPVIINSITLVEIEPVLKDKVLKDKVEKAKSKTDKINDKSNKIKKDK